MRRFYKFLTITLVFSYTLIAVTACRPSRRGEVEQELFSISSALVQYEIMRGGIQEPEVRTGGVLYSNLINVATSNTHLRLLPGNPRWDKAQSLVDPWGQEYRVEISQKTNAHRRVEYEIRVSSNGPNRRYEAGKGDDIVRVTLTEK